MNDMEMVCLPLFFFLCNDSRPDPEDDLLSLEELNRQLHWSVDLLTTAGKEALVFSAIGVGVAAIAVVVGFEPLVPSFGLVLLLEATGLMIIGGALDLSSSGSAKSTMRQMRTLFGRTVQDDEKLDPAEDRKGAQLTAAKYSLTGVLLFLEALVLAFVLY